MRRVTFYKKRGVPGINRIQEDDNGEKTSLTASEFTSTNLKAIDAKLESKKKEQRSVL